MVPPLTYPFLRYIESTRQLVIYRLDSSCPIPSLFRLPAVETLCLLDCTPDAVHRMVYRPFFPGLRHIHYLSPAPKKDPLFYERVPSVEWVFPWREGRVYPFYDAMIEAGKGRMEADLLSHYVAGWTGSWMDISLPGRRGCLSGQEYMRRQMAYLHKKHCDGYFAPYPIVQEDDAFPREGEVSSRVSLSSGAREEREDRFERQVLGFHVAASLTACPVTISRLGATPCHSSDGVLLSASGGSSSPACSVAISRLGATPCHSSGR